MRLLLAILTFVFCGIHLNGQPKVKTHLFKDQPKNLNIFINPTIQFSQIVQQYCVISGIRAGVIINKKIAIGALYNFTFKDITLPEAKGAGKLQMKWGGIHLEYTLWLRQKVHLTIPLSAGIGQLKVAESLNDSLTGDPNFFFAEPGLMIEINIWKYAKLGLGGCYRYLGNVSYNSLTSIDLSGFAAFASVKFGMFNYSDRRPVRRKHRLPKD